ncbi:MAG TPA: gephyrin-like molybdotransferase Glp [Candidatus Angelobacter sp.]|nr:gephyrin-like molybdotransferase Glp [Candidatus Angelobacter sp.]
MTAVAQSAGVLSFEAAYATVLEYCRRLGPPQTKEIALLDGLGRVLAEPILADRDFPPFPRATRDGYAVRADDLHTVPATLRVIGQIQAGAAFSGRVAPGQAVEIMTGAAVPEGADAVVMVEYTARASGSDQVEIQRAVTGAENVVARGAEVRAGQPVLAPGARLSAAQVALAAACGKARVRVYREPRVAILATGDELVEISETPGPFQIRNSNSYSLAAQVESAGGEAMRLPVAPDEPRKLAFLIHAGLEADMLLLSGGVSMGKFDLVEQALTKLGAEFFFTGALIQPGRPVVFGEVKFSREGNGSARNRAARDPGVLEGSREGREAIPFFGLPGNPVSTMVCFDLFARPVLQTLGGAQAARLPSVNARLKKDVKTKTGLTRFLPALLEGGLNDPQVAVVPWQGSGDVLASARANCYLVVPPDRETIAAGEMVTILWRG